jgi:hypothetical protein
MIWRRVVGWNATDISEENVASILREEELAKSETRTLFGTCSHADFLLGFFLDPEDWGDMFLRNIRWFSTDYMTLYPRR